MAIENMKNSEQSVRKKSKATATPCGQMTIIDSNKGESDSDLPRNVKKKKKKKQRLIKGLELQCPEGKRRRSGCEFKKKTCASSPILIESSLDSEPLEETRKRSKEGKKKRNPKLSCKPDGGDGALNDGQYGTAFHVNEKRQRNIPDVERHNEDLMLKRKVKKKEKRKKQPSHSLTWHSGDDEEPKKQTSGKQKANCQKTMLSNGKKRRNLGQDAGDECVLVKKKKPDYSRGIQGSSNGLSGKGIASSVCKLQGAQDCKGHTQGRKVEAWISEKGNEAIKKKESKKLKRANAASLLSVAKNQESHCSVLSEDYLKPQSKKRLVVCRVSKKANKAVKKKKKEKVGESSCLCFSEDGQDAPWAMEASARKGKKKVGKAEAGQDCPTRDHHNRSEISHRQQVKKRRKMGETGSFPAREGEPSVKRGKTNKPKETEDEIKLVAFKKGNCDEVNIDKVRRQALQDDIDRESGKITILEEESEDHFGQWGTAAFETSEQKAKFLRLLGGFTKGSALARSFPENATARNMALDQSGERKLQSILQADFEKAVAFKRHQGVGLGFQPATPGRLHIDKNASKSIKFED